jgi:hypothetical protein
MRPEVEVPCPRATLAAMIAAEPFEPRRSGKTTNHTVGSSLAGRISEAWPILAPPGDCAFGMIWRRRKRADEERSAGAHKQQRRGRIDKHRRSDLALKNILIFKQVDGEQVGVHDHSRQLHDRRPEQIAARERSGKASLLLRLRHDAQIRAQLLPALREQLAGLYRAGDRRVAEGRCTPKVVRAGPLKRRAACSPAPNLPTEWSPILALAHAYCAHHEIPRRSQGLHPLR